MSAGDPDAGWTNERSAAGSRNPWLIAAILSIATFMEVLDTSIANVALRHIAGALSASIDESTWVITSYLVSNAIILPVSGWLSGVIGRKRFYMISVALFAASSLACGLSPNLAWLITARVFQGLGGGGLAPSEQSMLADTFPPAKRAQAFALYGVTVIVAPALGPTIGGSITDNISWHWIFFINVPMGLLSLALVYLFVDEPETLRRERAEHLRGGLKVDWIGFVLVALCLGFLEIVLDKGQEDDWFNSTFIVCAAAISGLAFLLFVPWEITRKEPIVDIRLIAHRQFGTSWFVMLSVGIILFSSTQFMPQLLQENFGYTATLAGLALMPGGFAALVMMAIAGRISGLVQPRYLMAGAMITISAAMYHFTSLTPDVNFGWFAPCPRLPDGGHPGAVPDDHQLFLRRAAAREIEPGIRAHQCGAQSRRQHRRLDGADLAGPTRAVPSGAPCRTYDGIIGALSGDAQSGEQLFRRAWRDGTRCPKPCRRLDRRDAHEPGGLSLLYRRVRGTCLAGGAARPRGFPLAPSSISGEARQPRRSVSGKGAVAELSYGRFASSHSTLDIPAIRDSCSTSSRGRSCRCEKE